MEKKEKNKRKFLLFLPLLILPFVALGFYALGGGKGNQPANSRGDNEGINTTLPGAKLPGKLPNKLTVYDKASRDSALAKAASSNNAFAALGWDTAGSGKMKAPPSYNARVSEAKISRKLAEINRQVQLTPSSSKYLYTDQQAGPSSGEMDKLEKLIRNSNKPDTAADPEMKQLNAMLDKIMEIQHPSLAKSKQQAIERKPADSAFKAIPAIIDGNQKVAPGGVVRLRLQDTININGIRIPKGQTVFGACSVTNQRLLLDIKNIRLGTSIIPVNFTVFSLDGMAGIAAPEAELGEAAGSGADGALENMQFLSMDNNLSTQAATAGISAAKSLFGKKVRKIRVKLKGGETVLLRINRN